MRTFDLVRSTDVTGASGIGVVAQVIEFDTGRVAVGWIAQGRPQSVAVYPNLADAVTVHGHDGKTVLVEHENTEKRIGVAEETNRLRAAIINLLGKHFTGVPSNDLANALDKYSNEVNMDHE
mgnify:CR=1 FL=1